MTTDYVARKAKKKASKKLRQETAARGDTTKRERKKKNKVRAQCRGECYKLPALSAEDKVWKDDDDDSPAAAEAAGADWSSRLQPNGAASNSTVGVLKALPAKRIPKAKPAASASAAALKAAAAALAAKAINSGVEPPAMLRLSTGVPLLDDATIAAAAMAKPARSSAAAKAAKAAAAVDGSAAAAAAIAAAAAAPALAPFPPLIRTLMAGRGFLEPTPVQAMCWPLGCAGRDVRAVAEPGSGKTLAYLLPGIVKLAALGHSAESRPAGPLLLVLSPTRELAVQVAGECRGVRGTTGLRTVCVFGGAPRAEQVELLTSKAPHLLVATPGRLLDLVDAGVLSLAHVCYLVIDEADAMLSLGFAPQLARLAALLLPSPATASQAATSGGGQGAAVADASNQQISNGGKVTAKLERSSKKRQRTVTASLDAADGVVAAAEVVSNIASASAAAAVAAPTIRPQVMLFTATFPSEVAEAAGHWLSPDAAVVTVGHSADCISTTITQVVQVCAEHKKMAKLLKHLGSIKDKSAGARNPPRVLVFTNRIKTARFVTESLLKEGWRVAVLHGERPQAERDAAVADFKACKSQVLVATDVASRGLDIRGLPYVINYDFPSSLDTYIHRVGRTGRLAAKGHAFSFFTRNLAKLASPLIALLHHHGQSIDPHLASLAEAWAIAERQLGSNALLGGGRNNGLSNDSTGMHEEGENGGDVDDEAPVEGEGVDGGGAAGTASASGRAATATAGGRALRAEDLCEGLGASAATQQALTELLAVAHAGQKRREKKQSAAAAAALAAGEDPESLLNGAPAWKKGRLADGSVSVGGAGVHSSKPHAGDGHLVPSAKKLKVGERAAASRAAPAPVPDVSKTAAGGIANAVAGAVAFAPSARFVGSRLGCVFKFGPLGLGYYRDQPPKRTAGVAGKVGVATGGGLKARANNKAARRVASKPIVAAPPISDDETDEAGNSWGAKVDTSDTDDSAENGSGAGARRGLMIGNGRGGQHNLAAAAVRGGTVRGGRDSDGDSDDDDSDSGLADGLRQGLAGAGSRATGRPPVMDAVAAGKRQQHKSLPGRLRKKLAKDKNNATGNGSGGGRKQG